MEFKQLIVYQKALKLYSEIDSKVLSINQLDKNLKDQIRRASISIILNIAEGSSRYSSADRKNYYVISRGSAFECSAILDVIYCTSKNKFFEIESLLEEISKMLYKMISNLKMQIVENKTSVVKGRNKQKDQPQIREQAQ